MNPLGQFLKSCGGRNPAAMVLYLAESKHISTYRGGTSVQDRIAAMQVAMIPTAQAMQRRNHQASRAKLETQVTAFGREIARSIRQIRGGMPRGLVVKDLKAGFQNLYHNAYKLGMQGSSVGLVPGELPVGPEGKRWVESAFKHEMRFFNKFLAQAVETEMPPWKIDQRVQMYMNAVRGVYEGGRVTGSHPDSLIYWVYTPEAQHCSSCLYLRDHSPYTKRTLPTTPRAGGTECLSNCKCHIRIVISDHDLVKQVDARSLTRTAHMTFLNQLKQRRGPGWPGGRERVGRL